MRRGGWCRGTRNPGSPAGAPQAAAPQPLARHAWGPGCQGDVLGPLDEATSERDSAVFVEEEGPLSSWRGRQEVIRTQGRLSALSADRGAHSWYTERPVATGTRVGCQVPRARQQRGLTLIPASSPEAWGRSARAVRTVPDRLPHERALAGRTERAAANRYLTEQVLPQHNKRVSGRATEPGPTCIAWGRHVPRRGPGCARGARRGHQPYGAGSGHNSADPARPAPVP